MSNSVAFLSVTSRGVDRYGVGKSHLAKRLFLLCPACSCPCLPTSIASPKCLFRRAGTPRLLPTLAHCFPRPGHVLSAEARTFLTAPAFFSLEVCTSIIWTLGSCQDGKLATLECVHLQLPVACVHGAYTTFLV